MVIATTSARALLRARARVAMAARQSSVRRDRRVEAGSVIDATRSGIVRHAYSHRPLARATSAVGGRERDGVDAAVPGAGSFRPQERTRASDAGRIRRRVAV